MSILAIGTCMVIVAAAQTKWRSPWVLSPLRMLGRRSYEVYLTHMFVVFVCYYTFVRIGKPLQAVALLFLVTILISALLGEMVARLYSEAMNHWLRRHWGNGPDHLGSVVESRDDISRTKELAV
jgi:peptidoglycan/LPS O-acetylase OafA/YrhL